MSFDESHSKLEQRFAALGRTDFGRQLTVIFTTRGSLLRVISGRPMSGRERRIYAKRTQSGA
ncbi:MAG: BrnT family toxin [Spirochaetia bacterium]